MSPLIRELISPSIYPLGYIYVCSIYTQFIFFFKTTPDEMEREGKRGRESIWGGLWGWTWGGPQNSFTHSHSLHFIATHSPPIALQPAQNPFTHCIQHNQPLLPSPKSPTIVGSIHREEVKMRKTPKGLVKPYGKDTKIWGIYVRLWEGLGEAPRVVGPMRRGQAINLAMGLNKCNVQWLQESQGPSWLLTHSAKAKKAVPETLGEDNEPQWVVEVSESQRHQGKVSGLGWVEGLLDAAGAAPARPANPLGGEEPPVAVVAPRQPPSEGAETPKGLEDKQEDVLNKWLL